MAFAEICWYLAIPDVCWYLAIPDVCWYLAIPDVCWYLAIPDVCWYLALPYIRHSAKLFARYPAISLIYTSRYVEGFTRTMEWADEVHRGVPGQQSRTAAIFRTFMLPSYMDIYGYHYNLNQMLQNSLHAIFK